MGCGCKQKKTNRTNTENMLTDNLGEYTYEELKEVVETISTNRRLTTEQTDKTWELYNRIYHYDKLANRRDPNQSGKVGRNLIKLYEYETKERKLKDGKTEGTEETKTKPRSTRRTKKTGGKKNT